MRDAAETGMRTHTPGPWDFRIVPGSNPPRVTVSDRDENRNEHIALCYGQEHDAVSNARLIASAPRLLDAVLLMLEQHGMKHNRKTGADEQCPCIGCHHGRQAAAQAMGQEI